MVQVKKNHGFSSVQFPTTKYGVIRLLEQELRRYVPPQTFYRWLKSAGLIPGFEYNARDFAKVRFIACHLRGDRNLERASLALADALIDHPEWFPEADGSYFSESTTINTEAVAS
jgi:hypothetical protein